MYWLGGDDFDVYGCLYVVVLFDCGWLGEGGVLCWDGLLVIGMLVYCVYVVLV